MIFYNDIHIIAKYTPSTIHDSYLVICVVNVQFSGQATNLLSQCMVAKKCRKNLAKNICIHTYLPMYTYIYVHISSSYIVFDGAVVDKNTQVNDAWEPLSLFRLREESYLCIQGNLLLFHVKSTVIRLHLPLPD